MTSDCLSAAGDCIAYFLHVFFVSFSTLKKKNIEDNSTNSYSSSHHIVVISQLSWISHIILHTHTHLTNYIKSSRPTPATDTRLPSPHFDGLRRMTRCFDFNTKMSFKFLEKHVNFFLAEREQPIDVFWMVKRRERAAKGKMVLLVPNNERNLIIILWCLHMY